MALQRVLRLRSTALGAVAAGVDCFNDVARDGGRTWRIGSESRIHHAAGRAKQIEEKYFDPKYKGV